MKDCQAADARSADAVASTGRVIAFYDASWRTRWLAIGLVAMLLWRSSALIDREWKLLLPTWTLFLVTGIAPQLFLLLFPVATRTPNRLATFGNPKPMRCLREIGVACLVIIAIVGAMMIMESVYSSFFPGESISPDITTRISKTPNRAFAYIYLVLSFTFAPVAEEVFFRGFLQNAFRRRLPFVIATLLQCLLFGFGHFYGIAHSIMAVGIGLTLTAVYEWRKTLFTPIVVHIGLNFLWAIGTLAMMVDYANSPTLGIIGDLDDTECIIRDVMPGSAAEHAGLLVGDVIIEFNTEPIADFSQLATTVPLYSAGDTISIVIRRGDNLIETTVVLRRRG